MVQSLRPNNIAGPAIAVLLVFGLTLVFPPFGIILGLFAPAPLIFLYLQNGKQVGLISCGVVLVLIGLLTGVQSALVFGAEYVALALVMSESIKLRLPVDRTILVSALVSGFLSGFFLVMILVGQEGSIVEIFEQEVRKMMEQSIQTMREMGEKQAEIDAMRGFLEESSRTLASSFPAVVAVGSLMVATVNYGVIKYLCSKVEGMSAYVFDPFMRWQLADQLVWPLIVSGGLFFLTDSGIGLIGLNLFIFMLALYFLQGLAILFHFLDQRQAHPFFWGVALILIFIQPLFMGILIGLGLFDIWIDFRKLRTQTPDLPEE